MLCGLNLISQKHQMPIRSSCQRWWQDGGNLSLPWPANLCMLTLTGNKHKILHQNMILILKLGMNLLQLASHLTGRLDVHACNFKYHLSNIPFHLNSIDGNYIYAMTGNKEKGTCNSKTQRLPSHTILWGLWFAWEEAIRWEKEDYKRRQC